MPIGSRLINSAAAGPEVFFSENSSAAAGLSAVLCAVLIFLPAHAMASAVISGALFSASGGVSAVFLTADTFREDIDPLTEKISGRKKTGRRRSETADDADAAGFRRREKKGRTAASGLAGEKKKGTAALGEMMSSDSRRRRGLRILAFTKYRPKFMEIREIREPMNTGDRLPAGAEASVFYLAAAGGQLLVNGVSRKRGEVLSLPRSSWRISLGDDVTEKLTLDDLALEISAERGFLRVVLVMKLEAYVARTLASETEAGTPAAALEAQAVVARTYALFAQQRHAGEADLCDLAHCQVVSWKKIPEAHLAACRTAAEKTEGMTLVFSDSQQKKGGASSPMKEASAGGAEDAGIFSSGADASERKIIPLFHASCGGMTANPSEVFDGRDVTAAAPVADPECALDVWSTSVSTSIIRRILSEGLCGLSPAMESEDAFRGVSILRSAGGRVVQLKAGGCSLSGEAFIRRLGAAVGYGKVPSAIFRTRQSAVPGQTILTGRGRGHGVGLCQAGAARMARRGADFRTILQRYFPKAGISEGEPSAWSRQNSGTGKHKISKISER